MQELLDQVAAIAELRKEATPGPWVQWVEHPSVYAGPATENEPWTIRGVRVQVAECRIDQDSDMMSDFDEEQGPYDGDANAAFIAAVGGLDFDGIATALQAAPAKTADQVQADINRLLEQKQRNKLGREALLEMMQKQPARRAELEAEYAGMKRRAEDYDVRIQALDWVLAA